MRHREDPEVWEAALWINEQAARCSRAYNEAKPTKPDPSPTQKRWLDAVKAWVEADLPPESLVKLAGECVCPDTLELVVNLFAEDS